MKNINFNLHLSKLMIIIISLKTFIENGKEKFDMLSKNHHNLNEGITLIYPLLKTINRLKERL